MGRTNIAFLQQGVPGVTQCSDVVITPDFGDTPLDVDLYTPQTGGHIFYRLSNSGAMPTHAGDNATGATIRVGSNHVVVSTGSGTRSIRAVCYQDGYLDSNITGGEYSPP